MGRAALGAAAKSEIAAVRLTHAEKALLTRKYGSSTKALRKLVDKEMQEELKK